MRVVISPLKRFFRNLRLFAVMFFIVGAGVTLLSNFYNLQIKKGSFYSAKAQSRYRLSGYLNTIRGSIYLTDKNGNEIPAAINKTSPVIYAVPKEIEDVDEASNMIAELLGKSVDEVKLLLGKENDLYEVLVRKADPEQILKIADAAIKGVYIEDEESRFYPFNNLGAHFLGFVGAGDDDMETGRYGLESFYNKKLSGIPGKIEENKIEKSTPGENIQLTIDRNIQARAEEILKNVVETYRAVAGTVIVEDPKTGAVLAMGSYPDFDPNNYSKSSIKTFLNPAGQAVYEPGSIVKVLTMAAALDAGSVTPKTTFYDSGSLVLSGKTIKNWDLKAHGTITMTEVIEQSINTGAAFAERKLGHDNFREYMIKFGLSDKTGIDLPGELAGNLRNLASGAKEINFATASFGQGISLTPLELISAFSVLGNGGVLMRPYLNENLGPQMVRRVVSEHAAREVTQMMVSAVNKAKVAEIPEYNIAGKTGTAQVPDFKKGGYTDDVINTYAGYAPAYDPRFVILIKIEKPEGAPLAGATVVPAFRELAQFILNYYNIPPDRKSN